MVCPMRFVLAGLSALVAAVFLLLSFSSTESHVGQREQAKVSRLLLRLRCKTPSCNASSPACCSLLSLEACLLQGQQQSQPRSKARVALDFFTGRYLWDNAVVPLLKHR